MVFTAKWRLVDVQNGKEYHKAIHTTDEFCAKLKVIHAEIKTNPDAYIEELTVDKAAGKVRRVVYIKGEMKRDTGLIDLGHEHEICTPDGRKVKVKATVEGDNKLIVHEKGPDYESTIILTLHGDEITATLTSGGVVCTEHYKRV